MDTAKIMGLVRHLVGGVGAILVAFGLSDQVSVTELGGHIEAIAGGLTFIGAMVASVYSKMNGKKKAE